MEFQVPCSVEKTEISLFSTGPPPPDNFFTWNSLEKQANYGKLLYSFEKYDSIRK
jgi:hypothetical protein